MGEWRVAAKANEAVCHTTLDLSKSECQIGSNWFYAVAAACCTLLGAGYASAMPVARAFVALKVSGTT